MLLTHHVISHSITIGLLLCQLVMHHLLLLFLIDLLQQVPLQCLVLLFPIKVVSLQLIVNLVVIVLHIPIEQVI